MSGQPALQLLQVRTPLTQAQPLELDEEVVDEPLEEELDEEVKQIILEVKLPIEL